MGFFDFLKSNAEPDVLWSQPEFDNSALYPNYDINGKLIQFKDEGSLPPLPFAHPNDTEQLVRFRRFNGMINPKNNIKPGPNRPPDPPDAPMPDAPMPPMSLGLLQGIMPYPPPVQAPPPPPPVQFPLQQGGLIGSPIAPPSAPTTTPPGSSGGQGSGSTGSGSGSGIGNAQIPPFSGLYPPPLSPLDVNGYKNFGDNFEKFKEVWETLQPGDNFSMMGKEGTPYNLDAIARQNQIQEITADTHNKYNINFGQRVGQVDLANDKIKDYNDLLVRGVSTSPNIYAGGYGTEKARALGLGFEPSTGFMLPLRGDVELPEYKISQSTHAFQTPLNPEYNTTQYSINTQAPYHPPARSATPKPPERNLQFPEIVNGVLVNRDWHPNNKSSVNLAEAGRAELPSNATWNNIIRTSINPFFKGSGSLGIINDPTLNLTSFNAPGNISGGRSLTADNQTFEHAVWNILQGGLAQYTANKTKLPPELQSAFEALSQNGFEHNGTDYVFNEMRILGPDGKISKNKVQRVNGALDKIGAYFMRMKDKNGVRNIDKMYKALDNDVKADPAYKNGDDIIDFLGEGIFPRLIWAQLKR